MIYDRSAAIERLLQRAADDLWADLPDRPIVSLSGDRLHYHYTEWTSALFRHGFENEVSLVYARRHSGAVPSGPLGQDVALQVMRWIFNDEIERRYERHRHAQKFGLVINGHCHDLPVGRWQIDSSLLQLLDASGVDIRAAAAAVVAAPDNSLGFGSGGSIWTNWSDHTIIVAPEDEGMPIISTMMSVGRGLLENRILEIPDLLPETIMAAAPGADLARSSRPASTASMRAGSNRSGAIRGCKAAGSRTL